MATDRHHHTAPTTRGTTPGTAPGTPLAAPLAAALAAALLTGLVAALLLAAAGTASASDGYRYWNYFHVSHGTYVFAQTGPGSFTPPDGAVEAYRYGLSSTAAGITPRAPAATYTVDTICGTRTAGAGQKRVGVLIDYGTEADAGRGDTLPKPRAACAVVPRGANGLEVLSTVAKVRVQKQLTCGIDGYPASTCSVTVRHPPVMKQEAHVSFATPVATKASSTPPTADDPGDGGIPWPVVGAAVTVAVLGAGALALSRRRTNV